jgi:hypothetical protein
MPLLRQKMPQKCQENAIKMPLLMPNFLMG